MSLEWLLFLALLLVGAIPLYRKGPGRFVLILLGAVAVVGAVSWQVRQHRQDNILAEQSHSVPQQGRPGGFVTSDTCQSCHPGQYDSWHKSFHRTMTQFPTSETVRGDFNRVALELEGQTYEFERRGDEFWVEMPQPEWRALNATARAQTRPERVWRRISLATGSHHMQAYWVPAEEGNMQVNVPFSFLFADQRWVPRNDTFLMDPKIPSFIQVWNANCIQCHATAGQPRPAPNNWFLNDTKMAEAGIACEACHGPAERHVRANQNPVRRYAQQGDSHIDRLIVNPAKLDHRASAQVCGQCHSIKAIPPGHPWRYEGFSYRPGDDLEKDIPIVRPEHHAKERWFQELLKREPTFVEDRYWPDGTVRVSGREYNGLLETPCYQRGKMSCLSCHSMHQSDPNDQLAAGMESNHACLQCHDKLDVGAHTRHAAGSSGSSCYNCHMPHTTYGLMKAIRSHTVDSPSVAAALRTGRPNACNLCHLDKTLAWTADHLNAWYGQKPPALSPDDRQVSAAVLLALRGDAGQRALLAWHLGWAPARQASGEKWIAPYLAQLLDDPYSTVRYMAHRSLKELPGFQDFTYDFIAPTTDRTRARERAMTLWEQTKASDPRPETNLDPVTWSRLLQERNNKIMYLQE